MDSTIRRLSRIERVGKRLGWYRQVPGTALARTMLPNKGWGWSLVVGGMGEPSTSFTARTITGTLDQAEKFIVEYKRFNNDRKKAARQANQEENET